MPGHGLARRTDPDPVSQGWAAGSTRDWRRLRLFVLDRDRWLCQVPVPTLDDPDALCLAAANTVGHLEALAYGGVKLCPPELLRAECVRHNSADGQAIGAAKKRAAKAADRRGWSW